MSENPSILLPEPIHIQKMWSELLGKPVSVKKAAPPPAARKACGVAAAYRLGSGVLGAVLSCDQTLAIHAAAALMLLPPAASHSVVREGVITDNLMESAREILNVTASLFVMPGRPYVRLSEVHTLEGVLPEDLKAALMKPGARLDLDVTVAGYGAGKLTCIIP